MTSNDPSLSFEPSSAMIGEQIHKENDQFQLPPGVMSTTSDQTYPSDRRPSKEVRFSPMASPTVRSYSTSTNLPLLEKVPSASEIPRPNRNTPSSPSADFMVYMEQSRSVLDSQRASHEKERAAWEQERKLWDTERTTLLARIAELEFLVNKSGIRKLTSDSHYPTTNVLSTERGRGYGSVSNGHDSRTSSGAGLNQHPVWEGSGAGTVATRVFTNDEVKKTEERLPRIAESDPDKDLSPTGKPADRKISMGIPIEKIDSNLDGITLKPSALPPAFVAKIASPSSPSPSHSPNRRPHAPKPINLDTLCDESNLTRYAGHTPMERGVAVEGVVASQSTAETPTQENPLAPQTSINVPSERSDSYFPVPDDDPELKGPLSLESEGKGNNQFLSELDQRLLNEARRVAFEPPESNVSEVQDDHDDDDDGGPKLKLKSSMNFGSAFGASTCGNIE